MDAATLGLNIVCDRLQQALSRAAIQHAQHTGICLCGKELEDCQHAASADVLAVQETKSISCRNDKHRMQQVSGANSLSADRSEGLTMSKVINCFLT